MDNKNPKHIAIILDGNKRWASKNNLSILDGYKKGLEKIKIITQSNVEKKIYQDFMDLKYEILADIPFLKKKIGPFANS